MLDVALDFFGGQLFGGGLFSTPGGYFAGAFFDGGFFESIIVPPLPETKPVVFGRQFPLRPKLVRDNTRYLAEKKQIKLQNELLLQLVMTTITSGILD